MPLFPSQSAVTTKPATTPSPLPINLTANKWNAHGYMEWCFNYEKAHFLYSSSYPFLFERFVQRIVIGLRTTERERRNKKTAHKKVLAIVGFALPTIKKLRSSVPLADAGGRGTKTRLEENIYLWPCSFGAFCRAISLQFQF
jgi:hypothetical protein